jgi:hypothetical protein
LENEPKLTVKIVDILDDLLPWYLDENINTTDINSVDKKSLAYILLFGMLASAMNKHKTHDLKLVPYFNEEQWTAVNDLEEISFNRTSVFIEKAINQGAKTLVTDIFELIESFRKDLYYAIISTKGIHITKEGKVCTHSVWQLLSNEDIQYYKNVFEKKHSK